MKFALLTTAWFLCSSSPLLAAPPELLVMLGHTSATKAYLWVKGDSEAKLSIQLATTPQALATDAGVQKSFGCELTPGDEFMATVLLDGLAPATRYHYQIAADGTHTGAVSSFVTAPAGDGSAPGRLRFAFTSCLGRTGDEAAAGWAEMAKSSRADMVFLLGDNHYADTTERAGQSAAYLSHRSVPSFQRLARRIPIYGIWDDHDFGPNDSDGTAAGKENSLATFKDFWPNPACGEPDNPGIYYRFRRAGIEFFMLDCRYHRSPDDAPQDGTKTMLGARQLAWLKEGLKASTAKVKVIASGSEWQMNGHRDSWTSYKRERADILDFIRDAQVTGVLLLSGDRHFTGGYQIRGEVIEITSGPLGAKNFPTKNLPEMFLNQGEGKMYCVYEIDTSADPDPEVTLEVHRAGTGLIEKLEFSWEQVLGEAGFDFLPVGQPAPAPTPAPQGETNQPPAGNGSAP